MEEGYVKSIERYKPYIDALHEEDANRNNNEGNGCENCVKLQAIIDELFFKIELLHKERCYPELQ